MCCACRQELGCVCDVNNPRLRRRHLYWPTLWRIGATSVFAAWRRCLRYVLLDVGTRFFQQRQHDNTSANCSPDRLFSRFDFTRSLRPAACAIKYQPIQTSVSALGSTEIGQPIKGNRRLRLRDALKGFATQYRPTLVPLFRNWVRRFTVAAVPEPSTWAMTLLGFVGKGFITQYRWRPDPRSSGFTESRLRAAFSWMACVVDVQVWHICEMSRCPTRAQGPHEQTSAKINTPTCSRK
jgi:hypothetical protein